MKKHLLFLMLIAFGLSSNGQPASGGTTASDSTQYWTNWMQDLYDSGVRTTKDSFHMNAEVNRLLKDSAYRSSVYPAVYNWPGAIALINDRQLKKAFWHMINLYREDAAHRDLVLNTVFAYDSLLDMERVLTASFYTYGVTDPRVCRVKNNKPEIFRPDVMESNLAATRKIVYYIRDHRKRKG